ncbi:MAG: SBBP repeat-containing protein [Spirochaetes bacterium]|nr:SBBP repeat-containing protein [Spirochaetota bacterium]
MRRILFIIIIIFLASISLSAELYTVWTQRINSPGSEDDSGYGIDVDDLGNAYVTGRKHNGLNFDYFTIKYDPDGNTVWSQVYDNGQRDDGYYARIRSSYLYITGASDNGADFDFCTVVYDLNGNSTFTQRFNSGAADFGHAVTADDSGAIYVAGPSNNWNYFLIKYNSDGSTNWTRSGPAGRPFGIVYDNTGYVYVTGFRDVGPNVDYYTVKYSTNGTTIWTQQYDSQAATDDAAHDIVLDSIGNVYITGYKLNSDFYTIKLDSLGNTVWTQGFDGGGIDYGRGIDIGPLGYVYVGGFKHNGLNYDYFIIKYDQNGNTIWTQGYNGGSDDRIERIAVDNKGFVYATGYKDNGADDDFFTIKYLQPPYPTVPSSLSASFISKNAATISWQDMTINEEGFKIYRSSDNLIFNLIGTVTAGSTSFPDNTLEEGSYWYRIGATNRAGEITSITYKYTAGEAFISTTRTGVYPNYFQIGHDHEIKIVIAEAGYARIRIYNIADSLVKDYPEQYYQAGAYSVWDGKGGVGQALGAGLYFVVIKGENVNTICKVILKR